MHLNEARKIARVAEAGGMDLKIHTPDFDRARMAFHTLDRSNPANVELRREDMRLRDAIMNAAGNPGMRK